MRAAIFIDGAHLLKQVSEAGITPDYARLADHLLAPLRRAIHLDLLRCYFYYAPPWVSSKPTESELRRKAEFEKFAAALEDIDRWQVRLGKLERRRDGDRDVLVQKRVDVLLSVDMVRHAAAGHVQHAVLVAGDSDFIPAVQAVKESGVTISLWAAPDKSAHLDLIRACDEVQIIRWPEFPQLAKARPAAAAKAETEAESPGADGSGKKRRRRGGRGRGAKRDETDGQGAESAASSEGPRGTRLVNAPSLGTTAEPTRGPAPRSDRPAENPRPTRTELAAPPEAHPDVAAATRAAAATSGRLTPPRGKRAAPVVDAPPEPGDDVGNRQPADPAADGAAPKRRRRRGGRGRGKKSGS